MPSFLNPKNAKLPMGPTLKHLPTYEAEFLVPGQTNLVFNAEWQWSPHIPSGNSAGVSGWALCNGQVVRLHVCANTPCTARHSPIKYGNLPPPRHVRLIEPIPVLPVSRTVASAAESATTVVLLAPAAGSGAASSGENEVCPRRGCVYVACGCIACGCCLGARAS